MILPLAGEVAVNDALSYLSRVRDTVTIESGRDFRRAIGTVVPLAGSDIIVKVASRRGTPHQERYQRRDGIRVGSVSVPS
ncbi:hypothetical protein [Geodermatophilus siccatus]|uniref:hypothetical protein n=1 Tax=Geodermatophilus siccatus TaxID=1137991 RepID=UPI00111429B8|nr:hypothetical protein [Geodermatophilus siccatus]